MDLWPLEVYRSVPEKDANQAPASNSAKPKDEKPQRRFSKSKRDKSSARTDSSSLQLKPDTLKPDTLQPDTLQPDTLKPDTRRTSIQFANANLSPTTPPSSSSETLNPRPLTSSPASSSPTTTPRPPSSILKRPSPHRPTSPPPPPLYTPRLSFDTLPISSPNTPYTPSTADFSYTLHSTHRGYTYTSHSRLFLCGLDENDYSEYALKWLLEELADDGDEVVCFRVVGRGSRLVGEKGLSRGRYQRVARGLMERVVGVARGTGGAETGVAGKPDVAGKPNVGGGCSGRSISLTLEFAVGEVQKVIQRLIAVYEPASLVVGTRGRSLDGFQGLLPGSVSKYCLQNSPVPVIVVRPSGKREKKKRKRRADPSRRGYVNMVGGREDAGGPGQILERVDTGMRVGGKDPLAGEKEALAVARAVGLSTMEATLRASMVADTGRGMKPRVARVKEAEEDEEDEEDEEEDDDGDGDGVEGEDADEGDVEDEEDSEEEEAVSLDAVLSQSLKKDPKPAVDATNVQENEEKAEKQVEENAENETQDRRGTDEVAKDS